ncbi:MAG: DUF4184 family protein [Candidatus Bathyarchaeota archaeon]|nr:DUF4184 family protein [Candidatus Bathyarchaeota archaeon]
MPVTPLHYPIAKLLHMLGGKARLSLPGLIVGAMVPDLEVLFIWLLTGKEDRMVLHSLIGGLTLGTLLAVAITVLLYRPLVGAIFPVNKDKLKQNCTLSTTLAVSCLIGVLSHVLFDVANHTFNPLFWPFLSMYQTPSPITPLFGGAPTASLIVEVVTVALIGTLCLVNRRHLWNELLVG